jgi:hypothetical protein
MIVMAFTIEHDIGLTSDLNGHSRRRTEIPDAEPCGHLACMPAEPVWWAAS